MLCVLLQTMLVRTSIEMRESAVTTKTMTTKTKVTNHKMVDTSSSEALHAYAVAVGKIGNDAVNAVLANSEITPAERKEFKEPFKANLQPSGKPIGNQKTAVAIMGVDVNGAHTVNINYSHECLSHVTGNPRDAFAAIAAGVAITGVAKVNPDTMVNEQGNRVGIRNKASQPTKPLIRLISLLGITDKGRSGQWIAPKQGKHEIFDTLLEANKESVEAIMALTFEPYNPPSGNGKGEDDLSAKIRAICVPECPITKAKMGIKLTRVEWHDMQSMLYCSSHKKQLRIDTTKSE